MLQDMPSNYAYKHAKNTVLDKAALNNSLGILTSDKLSHLVELVAWNPEPNLFIVQSQDGSVAFRRGMDGDKIDFSIESLDGRNPIGVQAVDHFSPLKAELENKFPNRQINSYPYAFEHISQVFDHPCAPDIVALHTAQHKYDTNIGNHGSLSVIQARAPFIACGPGIRNLGLIDGHCRLIDVAPTILELMNSKKGAGIGPNGLHCPNGLYLSRQDGTVIESIIDHDYLPKRVLVFLLDGCNANVLYDASKLGQVPTITGLINRGMAFRYGAISTLPTVTLANHTSLMTGCFPAHHGVLHNAWWDRETQTQIVTESITTWHTAMQWLSPGTETIHQALKRSRPDVISYSVNEPADTGADWSTFEFFRQGKQMDIMPDLAGPFPLAHPEVADFSPHTRFGVVADTMALNHGCGLWGGELYDTKMEVPDFCWINMPLIDSVFHDTGPHSELSRLALEETDARIGEILSVIARRGLLDETAIFLVADHGMEESDPQITESWNPYLEQANIAFRDEAYGFIYLTP